MASRPPIILPPQIEGAGPDDDATEELLQTMRHRHLIAVGAYADSRENQYNDLKFAAASPDNHWQWPDAVLRTRGINATDATTPRPTLTINKLPQHIRQVTNEQRQNRPSGKVIPVDDNADEEVARIFDGIVRHIEYISDADVAYDTACENQVTFGEGYIRILTEFCDDNSFDQDIRIARVRNSFSVLMDPNIQDPCGADAEWCFVVEDIPKDEFKREYPDARVTASNAVLDGFSPNMTARDAWITKDTVRVAEYFYVEHTSKHLNLYVAPDGTMITAESGSEIDTMARSRYGRPVRERTADARKIKWVKTNGYEILEQSDWAGDYIPIVRVVGNEYELDGQLHISGLVRNTKDACRMINYWTSQEAEMIALAPKAPFIGYAGQFEGYERKWATANTMNWPYLEVSTNATMPDGTPLPIPQRAPPPMASTALLQAKAGAAEDLKATTGQFDSSMGAQSNERTGKAIMAREKQGDVGTYHYVDNFARAVRYVTRQLVGLIPKIYDMPRIARIVNTDGSIDMVKINPQQGAAVHSVEDEQGIVLEKIYNPSVGKYDVCVTTGPGYMTKRQEALDAMQQLLQSNPKLWEVAGDLFVKNMDWPGAQEMAERFSHILDPRVLQGTDQSPEMQQAQQQIQAQQHQLQAASDAIKALKESMQYQDVQVKQVLAQIKAYDAETRRLDTLMQDGALLPDKIQDIVRGTLHGMIASGDLAGPSADRMQMRDTSSGIDPSGQPQSPQGGPQGQPQPPMGGMLQQPPPDAMQAQQEPQNGTITPPQ